ncbi:hypothetical protein HY500_03105 [Candidatus Woesearchaeota archaeon]|nr:hypothetical protein [Candidatus Woesearchaeota archaeon]
MNLSFLKRGASMQIHIEKKHLYIFLSITILLFSSLYVIAQTFTSPAWDTSKQSHNVLYTNIITSKAATPRIVKVEGDLEITSGSGITLGGVKQTSWPTGGSPLPSSRCIVTSFSKSAAITTDTDTVCNPTPNLVTDPGFGDITNFCVIPSDVFPPSTTTFRDVVLTWCNARTGAGCLVELGQTYDVDVYGLSYIDDAISGVYTSGGAGEVDHYDLYISASTSTGSFDGDGQLAQFVDAGNGNPLPAWDPYDQESTNLLATNGCTFREEFGNNDWKLVSFGDDLFNDRACRLTICKKS